MSHPLPGSFRAVSLGELYGCALRVDDTIGCWAPDGSVSPAALFADGPYTAIDLPCALHATGTVQCDGLGPSEPSTHFAAVSADQYVGNRGCALRVDGTLTCWGAEGSDETGVELAMRAPAGVYSAVSVGEYSACAIRTDGRATCWGQNDESVRPGPSARLDVPPWLTTSSFTVRWSAVPAFASLSTYDVEYAVDPADWDAPRWVPWIEGTKSTTATFVGKPGAACLFRVRVRDTDGAVSPWAEAATNFPIDDRSLTATPDWKPITGSRFYLGTALLTTRRGARVDLANGIGSLVILGTTCPTCGEIELWWTPEEGGPAEPAKISLRSAVRHDGEVLFMSDFGEEGGGGPVWLTVISSGRSVILDGVLFNVPVD